MVYYCIMPDRGGYVICTTRSGNKGNPEPVQGAPLYADKAGAEADAMVLAGKMGGIYAGPG